MVTTFDMVAFGICGSSVWNLLHVTLVGPRILRFLENMCTPSLENVLQNLSVFKFTDLTSFREVNVLERKDGVLIQETLSSFNLIFAVMYYGICFTSLLDSF